MNRASITYKLTSNSRTRVANAKTSFAGIHACESASPAAIYIIETRSMPNVSSDNAI
jgi:hypothetical protein